jgi:hypothetical protein
MLTHTPTTLHTPRQYVFYPSPCLVQAVVALLSDRDKLMKTYRHFFAQQPGIFNSNNRQFFIHYMLQYTIPRSAPVAYNSAYG